MRGGVANEKKRKKLLTIKHERAIMKSKFLFLSPKKKGKDMKTEIELITESARKAKRKRLESVDPKEIKQVLAKAVKKIEKGTATFTTGSFARNKKGLSCPVGSHSARQFCSVGLVHRVVGIEPTETLKKQRRLLVDATTAALVDTYNAIYNAKEINITIINDYRLANGNANLFREALKRIEKEIENER